MQYIIILSLRQPFRKTEVIMYSVWLVVGLRLGLSLSCGFNRLTGIVCGLLLDTHTKTKQNKKIIKTKTTGRMWSVVSLTHIQNN